MEVNVTKNEIGELIHKLLADYLQSKSIQVSNVQINLLAEDIYTEIFELFENTKSFRDLQYKQPEFLHKFTKQFVANWLSYGL